MSSPSKTSLCIRIVASVILVGVAGCAAGHGAPAPWRALATFGVAEDLPRIVAYGNLARFVPQFAPTPALDEFLYGPSEPSGLLLRNPQGLTAMGNVLLVCDPGYPEIIGISLSSGRSNGWQSREHPPRCPVAIAHDASGRVYVADTTLRAVLVYAADGGFIEQLVPERVPFRSCSLAVGGDVLYVGNVASHRIERFDLTAHAWLAPIAPATSGPRLIAPTGLAVAPDRSLLIADAVQSRVFHVDADGHWLDPIGSPGRLEGQFVRPKQVACTPSGLIVVTDAGRQSVLVFDAAGSYITEIHESGEAWPGFTLPAGAIALPTNGLAALLPEGRPAPDPRPDEWILVTDSLNAASLNVFGVMLPQGKGATRAAP